MGPITSAEPCMYWPQCPRQVFVTRYIAPLQQQVVALCWPSCTSHAVLSYTCCDPGGASGRSLSLRHHACRAQSQSLAVQVHMLPFTSIACAPGGVPGWEPVARAVLRRTHISPQKLNDFARLLRRLHVEDALIQCEVSPKKAARICRKVGRSSCGPDCLSTHQASSGLAQASCRELGSCSSAVRQHGACSIEASVVSGCVQDQPCVWLRAECAVLCCIVPVSTLRGAC